MIVLLVLALSLFAAAGYLAFVEVAGAVTGVRASLARAASYGRVVPPIENPAPERRKLPAVDVLARIALRIAPGRERALTAARLQQAGLTRVRPDLFLALKTGLAVAGGLVGLLLAVAIGSATAGIGLPLTGAGVGFLLPDILLGRRVRSRREQLLSALPNALDLLAVSVEAGLGLDGALARYAETSKGPVAEELALLVTELRVGASRREVLRRFAERVPADETKSFVRAILHADQLGVSLSGTLRKQASEIRFRRQALAEEKANKGPVKMLFPTVFCIFPALFVVVLGPAILNLLKAL